MSSALPGLAFLAAFCCFTLALLAFLFFVVSEFLTVTLLILGLYLVFAAMHLEKHLHRQV